MFQNRAPEQGRADMDGITRSPQTRVTRPWKVKTSDSGFSRSKVWKFNLPRSDFNPTGPRTDRSLIVDSWFFKVKLFKENFKLNSKWWFNDYRMRHTFLLRPSQNKTNRTNGLLKALFEFFDLFCHFRQNIFTLNWWVWNQSSPDTDGVATMKRWLKCV